MQSCYKVELSWKLQLNREENKVKRASKEKKGNKGQELSGLKLIIKFGGSGLCGSSGGCCAQESIRMLGALAESGLLTGEGAVG